MQMAALILIQTWPIPEKHALKAGWEDCIYSVSTLSSGSCPRGKQSSLKGHAAIWRPQVGHLRDERRERDEADQRVLSATDLSSITGGHCWED